MSSCYRNAFLPTGVARDVLRNVTYVLHNGNRIGMVNGGTYFFLFQRSTAKSLTVDWVANVLYWIEGGSMVSIGIWFDSVDVCAQAVMCSMSVAAIVCMRSYKKVCVLFCTYCLSLHTHLV